MPYDEHEENGRFKRKFNDEDVLGVVRNNDGGAATSEVAVALDCSPRLALKRLRGLEEDGRVSPREVGNTYLWMVDGE